MTKSDIQQMLEILRLNYPATYKGMSREEREALVTLWLEMFGSHDTDIVGAALKNYIRTNKYPPTIAGLQEQIELITRSDDTDRLWSELMRAVRNSGRDARAEFEKLPEECKAFIGSPSELRLLGNTELTTVNTVTRGQFYKRVAEIKKRNKAHEQLPENVRKAIGTLQLGE